MPIDPTTADDRAPWWAKAGEWILSNHGIAALILIIQTCCGIWTVHYLATEIVPGYLAQIDAGYQQHAAALKETVKQIVDSRQSEMASFRELIRELRDNRAARDQRDLRRPSPN